MSSVTVMATTTSLSLAANPQNVSPKSKKATRGSTRASGKRNRTEPDQPFRCCDGLALGASRSLRSSKVVVEDDIELVKRRRTTMSTAVSTSTLASVESPRMSSRLLAKRKRDVDVEDADFEDGGRILVKAIDPAMTATTSTPTKSKTATLPRKRRRSTEPDDTLTPTSTTSSPTQVLTSTPTTSRARARPFGDSAAAAASSSSSRTPTPVRHSARLERKRERSDSTKEQREPEPESHADAGADDAGSRSRSLGESSFSRCGFISFGLGFS